MPRPVECVCVSQLFNALKYYEAYGKHYCSILSNKVSETSNAFTYEIDLRKAELKDIEKKINIIMDNEQLTEKKAKRLLEPLIAKTVSINNEIDQLTIYLDDAVEFDYISKNQEFARIRDVYGALSLKASSDDNCKFDPYSYGSGKMRQLFDNLLDALGRTKPKYRRQKIDRENGVTDNWRKVNRTNTNAIKPALAIFFPQIFLNTYEKDALVYAINNPKPNNRNQLISQYKKAVKKQLHLKEFYNFDFDLFGSFIIEFLSQVANGAKFETCHTDLNEKANRILPEAAKHYLEKVLFDDVAFAHEKYKPLTVYKSVGKPTRRQKRFYEKNIKKPPIECKPSETQNFFWEYFNLPVKTTQQESAAA